VQYFPWLGVEGDYVDFGGVKEGHIDSIGEAKPIANNDTQTAHSENRRVVIRRTDYDSSYK
jgi:outer membrane protein OmpA-like peptidoglycan-associated protein